MPILRTLLSSVGLGFLISGCDTKPDYTNVVTELRANGFFAHFDDSETRRCETSVLEHGWQGVDCSPRFYFADAERLAEGGVAEFIESLQPFLGRLGVKPSVADNWGDHDYTITLDGKEYLIWSVKELKEHGNVWGLATVRTFEIINNLLAEQDTTERLFALQGGNDLGAIFLTDQMKQLLWQSSDFRRGDLPYIPVSGDDSWYGQPH